MDLPPEVESRYRRRRTILLTFVPAVIVGFALGACFARVGVWVGTEDAVGRVLLLLTAACAVAARFWSAARAGLTFLIIAAFGGRAFGFLLVAPPGLGWVNRIGAALVWASITAASLLLVLYMDTAIAFRAERRAAGIE